METRLPQQAPLESGCGAAPSPGEAAAPGYPFPAQHRVSLATDTGGCQLPVSFCTGVEGPLNALSSSSLFGDDNFFETSPHRPAKPRVPSEEEEEEEVVCVCALPLLLNWSSRSAVAGL